MIKVGVNYQLAMRPMVFRVDETQPMSAANLWVSQSLRAQVCASMYATKPYTFTGEFGRRSILVKGFEEQFAEQRA